MKKILILILMTLLLALSIFVIVEGIKIGKIEILGVRGIQEKNFELEDKIEKATKMATTDYKKAVSTVEENSKKLEQEKTKYEEMVSISTESEVQEAAQLPTYEVEYLWTKIGNHATSEGAVIKMDITKGTNNTQDNYNLKFTVNGTYISITDFIYDIENDSSLGFKIEEFKMTPGDGENLQATFTCKGITINYISQDVITTVQKDKTNTTINNEDNINNKINNTTNNITNTNTVNVSNTTNVNANTNSANTQNY